MLNLQTGKVVISVIPSKALAIFSLQQHQALFSGSKACTGERMNDFVTRLSGLAEYSEYREEKDKY